MRIVKVRRHVLFWAALFLVISGSGGCNDPAAGTIRADRRAVEQVTHAGAETPPASKTRSSRKRPDLNDLSPKVRGGSTQP
jgi:hypothetical protein